MPAVSPSTSSHPSLPQLTPALTATLAPLYEKVQDVIPEVEWAVRGGVGGVVDRKGPRRDHETGAAGACGDHVRLAWSAVGSGAHLRALRATL